ncbi:MBIP [Bugula neritina]|uniref:MBIP n=1 Tax=Bugula neritina TaxID=10212 RepID=A0A7J7KMQ9_BUGNE|nr:MBIP [Bugula neritina]
MVHVISVHSLALLRYLFIGMWVALAISNNVGIFQSHVIATDHHLPGFRMNEGTNEYHVQIHATREEMHARINAFCSRKRAQIDERNVEVFCGVKIPRADASSANHTSCARVDATRFPVHGKSRFKVSSVHNQVGPQTIANDETANQGLLNKVEASQVGVDIEGRLRDLENHCEISGSDYSVIERIKLLEDRILHLESITPEYFTNPHIKSHVSKALADSSEVESQTKNNNSTPSIAAGTRDMSLTEIDERIKELKERLRLKSLEQG